MSNRNFWSKKNWFVVSPICTGHTLSDTKVSFVVSVASKGQDLRALRANIEDDLKAIKCRIRLERMHQHKQGNVPNWTLDIQTKEIQIIGSYINAQTTRREGESLTLFQGQMFKECPKTTYTHFGWCQFHRLQKWINNYFTLGKFNFVFLSDLYTYIFNIYFFIFYTWLLIWIKISKSCLFLLWCVVLKADVWMACFWYLVIYTHLFSIYWLKYCEYLYRIKYLSIWNK